MIRIITIILPCLICFSTALLSQTGKGSSTASFVASYHQERFERDVPGTLAGDRINKESKVFLALELAHFRWKNLQVGLAFDLLLEKDKTISYHSSTGQKFESQSDIWGFGFSPVARYYVNAKNFLMFFQLKVTTGKLDKEGIGTNNFLAIRTGAGVDYFISENLALEALVDTNLFQTQRWQGTLFKVGTRYFFEY